MYYTFNIMLPEGLARQNIDAQLTAAGWQVQDRARQFESSV
jgi:type I site-specific restriction endonuclease